MLRKRHVKYVLTALAMAAVKLIKQYINCLPILPTVVRLNSLADKTIVTQRALAKVPLPMTFSNKHFNQTRL